MSSNKNQQRKSDVDLLQSVLRCMQSHLEHNEKEFDTEAIQNIEERIKSTT